jgi:hypothetical protein
MMSAAQCRAKALDALASADATSNPKLKLDWEVMSRQWAGYADQIDYRDASRHDPVGPTSN